MIPVPEETRVPAAYTTGQSQKSRMLVTGNKMPPDLNPSSIEVESDPKGLSPER